jgi:2-oxoacid:acceptor oxidoreductase delta subunit (pyruvate/2-ketoisovalerate family)
MIPEKEIKNLGIKGVPNAYVGQGAPERSSWRVFTPTIDYSKCIRCHQCWLFCPDAAYSIDKKGYTHPDPKTCKGCGICANQCPVKCIKMEKKK